MVFRLIDRRFLTGLAVSGFFIAVAGCQSGNNSNTLAAADSQGQATVTENELRAYCPPITLPEATGYINLDAKGKHTDDPAKLAYQASITDVTRSCTTADGMMTITVAVAGKVVPGPAGTAGTVNLPIRIVVGTPNADASEFPYEKTHSHQVALSGDGAASQFVFSDPNVIIPIPTERNLRIYAGYDEGPPSR